jgi:aerobic carbon-monoxide dehydrogenase medium subunit
MKPAPFEYVRPAALKDVLRLRQCNPETSRLIAGGQSLLATLAFRLSEPTLLIDITQLPELKGISVGESVVRVGALTTHAELCSSLIIRGRLPVLAEAARLIAHPAIRNRGTIGGSLAYADPAAELPACCVALGAAITAVSLTGRRAIPAAQFFTGLFTTALADDEVIAAIEFPRLAPGARTTILELARRSGDYAMAGLVTYAAPGEAARLVFFGVGDGPVHAPRAGAALGAGPWPSSAVAAAQAALDSDLNPPGDQHGGPALKRHLARVLLGRAVSHLSKTIQEGTA